MNNSAWTLRYCKTGSNVAFCSQGTLCVWLIIAVDTAIFFEKREKKEVGIRFQSVNVKERNCEL